MHVLAVTRTADEVFLLVFGGIAVIVVVARLVGRLFAYAGQPAVVGEVVGGVLLGPSVLGLLPGDPSALLFPPDIQPFLRIIAAFGLVIYMFIVGLELDPRTVRTERRAAVSISLASIATPFVFGSLAGLLVYSAHNLATKEVGGALEPVDVDRLPFVLFCGLAICGSAFAILARILDERQLFRTRLGGVLLASTVVDDIVVWMLASVVLAIAAAGGLAEVPLVLLGLVAFVIVLFAVVRPALRRLLRDRGDGALTSDVFAIILVGLLASALYTTWLEISPILGAFFFGAAVPREGTTRLFAQMNERLESISVLVLLPVFFAVTGLGVDLSTIGLDGLLLLAMFVVVATGGKMIGAAIGASLNQIRGRRALAVGVLMNTRGLSELALISIGRSLGIFDTTMFSVLVCTAIVTTLISGPLLRLVYPQRAIDADIEAFERSRAAEARAYRVLVLVDDPDEASAAVEVAVELARSEAESDVVLSRIGLVGPRTELGSGFMGDLARMTSSLDELRALSASVTARGVEVVPQSQFTDDITRELLGQVERLRPHLVVLPHGTDRDLVDRLVHDGHVDVVVAPAEVPPEQAPVCVETGPDPHLALALEVGVRWSLGGARPLILGEGRRLQAAAETCQDLGVDVVAAVAGPVDGSQPIVVAPAACGATVEVHAHESGTGPRTLDTLRERLQARAV